MNIKSSILLFLSLSLSLPSYASMVEGGEEYAAKGYSTFLSLSSNKRKPDEQLETYAGELEDMLKEDSKKRKVSDLSPTNSPLAQNGIIESLIEIFVKDEDTEVSIKGLHNLLRTSKSFCTSKNLRYVISLENQGLSSPKFIRFRVKSLNEEFNSLGFPSVQEIFSGISLCSSSITFPELVKEWGRVGLKLKRQATILPNLNHNELINIINDSKNPMQNRAISYFLARKHINNLSEMKENVRIAEPIILEKLHSKLLNIKDLAHILRVKHYSGNIKFEAKKALEAKKGFYENAPLESLLEVCKILHSKQQSIKSLSIVVYERLENNSHTLSTKELMDYVYGGNFPSQLIKPLVQSIWTSIRSAQDLKNLIDISYKNINSDFNQKFLKSLWGFEINEIISEYISDMDLNSLEKFGEILEIQKSNIKDYEKIEVLFKKSIKISDSYNTLSEIAVNSNNDSATEALLPIEWLAELNSESIPNT